MIKIFVGYCRSARLTSHMLRLKLKKEQLMEKSNKVVSLNLQQCFRKREKKESNAHKNKMKWLEQTMDVLCFGNVL
ncbi:hypothetical protein B9Z55_019798 [Caenorhabditis nigoni]|uniref:Uncharacterized protein n=1 Tax=Caenorhabditis nigoni TaxID=1611254 RepID=A0A2G5TJW6_9PELO|nr:hypothetical protein B9Z55_019798 [Caenorhabditis nigoni]